VKDIRIHFHTTRDDREGGIVKVELFDPAGQTVFFSHGFPEYPPWEPNSKHEVVVPVNRKLPLSGLRARITLTDENEVDITCDLRGPAISGECFAAPFNRRGSGSGCPTTRSGKAASRAATGNGPASARATGGPRHRRKPARGRGRG
jgi:hypothetical protein